MVPSHLCHTHSVTVINRLIASPFVDRLIYSDFVEKLKTKYGYPLGTRLMGTDAMLFLNYGYEEDPPMALPLAASDEPNRFFIQQYHRTATQADLSGKRVLEVGCGHGGGASYLMRTLHPASYTGLDLNPAAIALCRRTHHLGGLDFVRGDAENLPFADQFFDAVINVESSHCYPRFPRFLSEWRVCCAREGVSCTPICARASLSPNGKRRWLVPRCGCFCRGESMRRLCARSRKTRSTGWT